MGACRKCELYNMKVKDIQDFGTAYIVTVPKTRTRKPRKFTISDQFYPVCKKYLSGRTEATNTVVFLQYRNNKISRQRIGIHSFTKMGKEIAKFLKLENPNSYTGHSFCRSSATIMIDAEGDIVTVGRRGAWRVATATSADDCVKNKGDSVEDSMATNEDARVESFINNSIKCKEEDFNDVSSEELMEINRNADFIEDSVKFEKESAALEEANSMEDNPTRRKKHPSVFSETNCVLNFTDDCKCPTMKFENCNITINKYYNKYYN